MTKHTPQPIEGAITAAAGRGREAWLAGDLAAAERQFLAAWDLVPEPKTEYDYGQILSRGLVIFFRDTRQFDKAKEWLSVMREAYGPEPNASVEFLAATVDYAAGDLDAAYTRFDALHQQFGRRPFQGEKPDYLKFYKSRAARRA
jgi:hypothetical protein